MSYPSNLSEEEMKALQKVMKKIVFKDTIVIWPDNKLYRVVGECYYHGGMTLIQVDNTYKDVPNVPIFYATSYMHIGNQSFPTIVCDPGEYHKKRKENSFSRFELLDFE